MIIQPNVLSLITTHRCTAACDHCCFDCSPKLEAAIPVAHLHEYIDQAAEVPSLKVVVFTGGECFLLGKDLDALVGRAAGHGFIPRFVSNGYWASSAKVAEKRLGKLVDQGLKEANFSTGDMHAKYVKPENIIHGAVAAAARGLQVMIMVETFENSQFDFQGFVDDARLKPLLEDGSVSVKLSPWMRFNGTTNLDYTEEYMKEMDQSRFMGCGTLMNVIAITPSEKLIACCGLTMEEIEEVSLGSLRGRSIRQILHETPDDFVKIWIHLQGPDAIIRYARSIDPSIEVPDNMAHVCEVCRYMYHHEKVVEVVMKHPPPNKDEIVREYVMSILHCTSDVESRVASSMVKRGCSVEKVKELRKTTV